MNIVIPIVGRGTRVKDEFQLPKPLIKLKEKTIIEHCVESLNMEGNYFFIIRRFSEFGERADEYTNSLQVILNQAKPGCKIVEIDYVTEGPASSVLLVKDFINNFEPLLITNCDQRTDWNSTQFLDHVLKTDCDGCVTTYPHPDIKINEKSPYSFIALDETGIGIKLEEKFAISEHALNGIHYWKSGNLFVESAEQMIKENDRINNEFYISKTYNYLIKNKKRVVVYQMHENEFYALGDPKEISRFLSK